MYRRAADVARSAWDRGPYGKVLAVLWVVGVARALGGVRAAVTHAPQWARASGTSCGLAGVDLTARARSVVTRTGLHAVETRADGAPTWQVGTGSWTLMTTTSVCDAAVQTLRGATPPPATRVDAPGQDPASKLAEVEAFLEAHGVGLPPR